ncbi:hypothetical protein IFR05_005711 [Cadophora sp. M221]|nr:hypothetical protein IFR05_005711 [Cadophora sp. M221]
MYLNNFRAPQGSLVFGGFDTAKFSGTFQTVPLSADPDEQFRTFFVPWTSFTFDQGVASNNTGKRNDTTGTNCKMNLAPGRGLPDALIDSGDPAFSLPAVLIKAMGKVVGAKVANGTLTPIPCTAGDSGAKFTVGFANAVNIDVPLLMLLLRITDGNGKPVTNRQGQKLCQLPVEVSETSSTLGAPFMQAAYIRTWGDSDEGNLGISLRAS